jgi:hypothetical protein
MQDSRQEYIHACEAWQVQLNEMHKVLLEGQRLEPPKLKAILNREARTKERYDSARRRLLGLSD